MGDARVVSLGEASHGTSEYFTLKHRFVKYLVEHHGFTEFSIEANFGGSRVVDEWVQGAGPDTPEAANIALSHTSYHTWDTVEVLEMIRWMRTYNKDRPAEERVHFHGFDIGGGALQVRQYLEYLQTVDPGALSAQLSALGPMARGDGSVDRTILAKNVAAAIAGLDANRDRYVAASSSREFAMTRLGLHDAHRGLTRTPSTAAGDSMTHRDTAMADNCAGLLEAAGEGRKLIVWAHNAHVARHTMEVPANISLTPPADGAEPEPPEMGTVKSQGWHLAERFGAEQRVIGFALGGGHVKMWDLYGDRTLKDREFGPPPEDTLDAALAQLGEALVAVDVRNPPTEGAVAEWLKAPRRSRSVTAGWFSEMSEFFTGRNWLPAYDVIVFVEKSTGMTYNPTVVMSLDEMGTSGAPASEFVNLDFSDGLEGWTVQSGGPRPGAYELSASDGVLQISRVDTGFRMGAGGVVQMVDAAAYRGQRVTVKAESQAEVAGLFDRASLSIASSGAPAVTSFTGSEWSDGAVSVDVPDDATHLSISLRLHGSGSATFRDLTIESKPVGSL